MTRRLTMRNVTKWFAMPELALRVDGGRVFCPARQQDMDVEACMTCPYLKAYRSHGGSARDEVVCTPTFRALAGTGVE
jgi:hypothetical protein